MKHKRIPVILLITSILLLSACNKKAPKEEVPVPETKEPEQTEQTSEKVDKYHFPLTGIGTDVEPNRRAVAVTINNHPAARPQTGLSQADIVYELLAEGNVTRFLAVFQSETPENIGPVRSARPFFIELAQGFNGLFIAHGYSPDAEKILSSGVIDQLNGMKYDGTLFKRSSDRNAPHNSYITFENIEKGAQDNGFSMTDSPASMDFYKEDELESINGNGTGQIKVAYGNSSEFTAEYRFDAQSGEYSRFSNGEQTVEYKTGEPVLVKNLFVIETEHKVLDSAGRRFIDLQSGGKAYLFQNGIMKEMEWKSVDGRILPYENGQPAKLVPGKTWVNIVPSLDAVSFEIK
ncbi:DUF3048 domain-containing protein [Lederbergia panacisoli]|uniref:DUF3048 domain-containing protein n=1 Tax=Lederbergia panacisoli TaxID=1255251 RepID=UPI00214D0AA0|nr:DUF3048 domain-containing protein [Lederbergia panacisoli]MCR2823420.1 DUF3048 domain-containing protein [Lederbergia panacisoli]